jgi:hypothetical protein
VLELIEIAYHKKILVNKDINALIRHKNCSAKTICDLLSILNDKKKQDIFDAFLKKIHFKIKKPPLKFPLPQKKKIARTSLPLATLTLFNNPAADDHPPQYLDNDISEEPNIPEIRLDFCSIS